MIVNREPTSTSEFYFQPVNLWYASSYFNKITEKMNTLNSDVQKISNNAGILSSGYYSSLASSSSTKYNMVLEDLVTLQNNFNDYKAKMMELDSSLEMLFLYLENCDQNIEIDDEFILDFYNLTPEEQNLMITKFYLDYCKKNADLLNDELKKMDSYEKDFYNGNVSSRYFKNVSDNYLDYMIIDEYSFQVKSPAAYRQELEYANPYASKEEIDKKVAEYSKVIDAAFVEYTKDKLGKAMTFDDYNLLKMQLDADYKNWDNARYLAEQEVNKLQFEVDYPLESTDVYSGGNELTFEVFGDDYIIRENGKNVDTGTFNPLQVKKYLDEHNEEYYSQDFLTFFEGNYPFYDSLTEEQKNTYNIYYEKYGRKVADQYFESIKDTINKQYGYDLAEEKIEEATDEYGNVNWGSIFGDGIYTGVSTWFDGVNNAFHADGVRTATQYMQMSYMNWLTNSSGLYIQDLIEEQVNTKGDKYAESLYKKLVNEDGSINLDNARYCLSPSQYNKLIVKMKNDKNNFNQFGFEMGSTVGNMLPSTVIASVASLAGAPVIFLGGENISIASLIGQAAMGMSVYGNSKNDALIGGAEMWRARLYGLLSASSEVGLSLILGNIPGLNDASKFSLSGFLSEGAEEFLQEYISAGLESAVLGKRIDLADLNEQAAKSFLYGMLLSAGMNTVNLAGDVATFGANVFMNGQQVNLSDANSIITLMSLINDGEIKFVDIGGTSALVLTEGSNIDYGQLNTLFPDTPIPVVDAKGNITSFIQNGSPIELSSTADDVSQMSDLNELYLLNEMQLRTQALGVDTSDMSLNELIEVYPDIYNDVVGQNLNGNHVPVVDNVTDVKPIEIAKSADLVYASDIDLLDLLNAMQLKTQAIGADTSDMSLSDFAEVYPDIYNEVVASHVFKQQRDNYIEAVVNRKTSDYRWDEAKKAYEADNGDGSWWNDLDDQGRDKCVKELVVKDEILKSKQNNFRRIAEETITSIEILKAEGKIKPGYSANDVLTMIQDCVPQETYLTVEAVKEWREAWSPDERGYVEVYCFQDSANSYALKDGVVGRPIKKAESTLVNPAGDGGTFVMTKQQYEKIINDPTIFKNGVCIDTAKLGVELGGVKFYGAPVAVKQVVPAFSVEMPMGNNQGSFLGEWRPGGKTSGGVIEGVVPQNFTDTSSKGTKIAGTTVEIKVFDVKN